MINKLIARAVPMLPKSFVKVVAGKYIAGPNLSDAVRVTQDLMRVGGMSTIDVLGEFVETREKAQLELAAVMKVLEAIHDNNLKSYLSVKPTSLGLGIQAQFGYENIKKVVSKARDYHLFVRLDMENSPYTDLTLDMYRKLREEGFDNVGIVLQAYMRRSESDVRSLLPLKPNVRLCKGIYVESERIAYKGREEIRSNYKLLLRALLDGGCYVGIATHDEPLIRDAEGLIRERNLGKSDYEFQMLLGVREDRRSELLRAGHPLRVYVPFGEDWYGYSVRRLNENPQIAGHIVKSILGVGK
ncbi:MAG: proline dehydrogenase family protein [Chloroflexota bacterium]